MKEESENRGLVVEVWRNEEMGWGLNVKRLGVEKLEHIIGMVFAGKTVVGRCELRRIQVDSW